MNFTEPTPATAAAAATARGPWGVAALLLATADALNARFGAVAVRGEISGFSRAASGHCYFSLKDADGAAALLRCAMFRRAAALVNFTPADGQQVELRGRLSLYEPRGELSFVVEAMQRLGEGALYEEFLRRRARLQAQGLFDSARKRPLPPWPRRLGIVTSLQAAALRDVLTTLARRAPQVQVVVYPSPVQGAEAPAALAQALYTAGQRGEVELLLLVRGGGSLEDLWAFNDERVVRAVAASPVPVVCGVGHETDVTLADLAADLRAPTPTAAAELAAPAQAEALAALRLRDERLQRAVQRLLQRQAQQLDGTAARLGRPAQVLAPHLQKLLHLRQRLQRALAARQARLAEPLGPLSARLARALQVEVQRHRLQLGGVQARLQAQDPAQVLRRGYAWVESADGRPVVSAAHLVSGQQVKAVWADGQALAQVLQVTLPTPPGDQEPPTPSRR